MAVREIVLSKMCAFLTINQMPSVFIAISKLPPTRSLFGGTRATARLSVGWVSLSFFVDPIFARYWQFLASRVKCRNQCQWGDFCSSCILLPAIKDLCNDDCDGHHTYCRNRKWQIKVAPLRNYAALQFAKNAGAQKWRFNTCCEWDSFVGCF